MVTLELVVSDAVGDFVDDQVGDAGIVTDVSNGGRSSVLVVWIGLGVLLFLRALLLLSNIDTTMRFIPVWHGFTDTVHLLPAAPETSIQQILHSITTTGARLRLK